MNEPLATTLQRILDRWQRFAPAAGANVTVLDGTLGARHGASGVADVDSGEPMTPGAFFRRPAYGFGLVIDESRPHGGFHGHGGDGPGFNTFAMHLPRFGGRPLTLAVFCNTTLPHHPIRLCRTLLEALSRTDSVGIGA